jgi:hypothetical protein
LTVNGIIGQEKLINYFRGNEEVRTRFFTLALIMGSAVLGLPLAGLCGDEYTYRFLWPAEVNLPGENLTELTMVNTGEGEDTTPLGVMKTRSFDLADSSGETVAATAMMTLPGRRDLLIFRTEIKKAIPKPTGEYEKPHFALPAIRPKERYRHVLDFVVEEFITPIRYEVPTTGPVVMYTEDLDALIMSPLDKFMDAMQAPVKGEWHCGFGGLNEKIPTGTVSWTMLVSGHGINDTFMKWGKDIQDWYGHKPVDAYADVTLSHLGYWTDNGSYYYYRTEPGMNYHETLLAVKEYALGEGIPYAYFQIDSWWYPKALINLNSSHDRGGFLLWEPNPDMFPHGLEAFQHELGLPLVAHNRYCADSSPYCEKYQCVYHAGDKREGAYPTDPAFWDEVMDNAVKYGVAVYEQDWLYTHMDMIPWMRQNLGNAASWYDNMASAAFKRGLTMQLCMASPEFLLQQLKHPVETHVRTSHDYKGGLPKAFFWMPFHKAGLYAWAVGLWPFKDNFQSTVGQKTTYHLIPEGNPMEEALVAVLSGGPVGPSDSIGGSDASLIMRSCRSDGLLLKPDRPATPIDIMFLYNKNIFIGSKKPWVVTTESAHEIGKTTYLASFNLWPQSMYQPWVTFQEAGVSGPHLVYDYRTGEHEVVSDRVRFGFMKPEEGVYYVLCPILETGMAVIGETGKFVTMSARRFPSVRLVNHGLLFEVEGVPGEIITISIYAPSGIRSIKGAGVVEEDWPRSEDIVSFDVKIPETGRTVITLQ